MDAPTSPPARHRNSPNPPATADDWEKLAADFLAREGESLLAPTDALHSPAALSFRHSGWQHDRERVITAMQQTPELSPRRLEAFKQCGADARVETRTRHNPFRPHDHDLDTTEYRLRSTKCHDRFCVPCARERASRIQSAILRKAKEHPRLSFITLTLKATPDPLKDRLDLLITSFAILRTKKIWTKTVSGGVAVLECKVGESGHWHPHLHILAETKFIAQHLLSNEWLSITGDSMIVDIRRVNRTGAASQYITKYVTKLASASILRHPPKLQEALTAFHGRRLCTTFGTWRGLQLSEDTDYDPDEHSPNCGPWQHFDYLGTLLAAAASGDPAAALIIAKAAPGYRPPRSPPRPAALL